MVVVDDDAYDGGVDDEDDDDEDDDGYLMDHDLWSLRLYILIKSKQNKKKDQISQWIKQFNSSNYKLFLSLSLSLSNLYMTIKQIDDCFDQIKLINEE